MSFLRDGITSNIFFLLPLCSSYLDSFVMSLSGLTTLDFFGIHVPLVSIFLFSPPPPPTDYQVVPTTVRDQLLLWEKERNRISVSLNHEGKRAHVVQKKKEAFFCLFVWFTMCVCIARTTHSYHLAIWR